MSSKDFEKWLEDKIKEINEEDEDYFTIGLNGPPEWYFEEGARQSKSYYQEIIKELVDRLDKFNYKVDINEPYCSLMIPTIDMIEANKAIKKTREFYE